MKALRTASVLGLFVLGFFVLTCLVDPSLAHAKYVDKSNELDFGGPSTGLLVGLGLLTAGVVALALVKGDKDDSPKNGITEQKTDDDSPADSETETSQIQSTSSGPRLTAEDESTESKVGLYYDCGFDRDTGSKVDLSDLKMKVGVSLSF